MPFYSAQVLLIPGCVLLASLLGTLVVRWLSRRNGWMALPRVDRWHQYPIALHGGVGFYPCFVVGSIWVVMHKHYGDLQRISFSQWRPADILLMIVLLAGSLFMFLVGLLDDQK